MLVAISSPVMFSKNVFFVFFSVKFCAKFEVVNKNNLGQSLRVRRFNLIWCGSKMAYHNNKRARMRKFVA